MWNRVVNIGRSALASESKQGVVVSYSNLAGNELLFSNHKSNPTAEDLMMHVLRGAFKDLGMKLESIDQLLTTLDQHNLIDLLVRVHEGDQALLDTHILRKYGNYQVLLSGLVHDIDALEYLVDHGSRLLSDAPDVLKNNKAYLLKSIASHPLSFEHASDSLKADRELALFAVKEDPLNLKCASSQLRSDKEVVLVAISRLGRALRFVSECLADDRNIVLAAIHNDGYAWEYASVRLKSDLELALMAVIKAPEVYRLFPTELKSNRSVAMAAISRCGQLLGSAPDQFHDDKELVLSAVRHCGISLEEASVNMRSDKEVALAAVQQNYYAILLVSEDLSYDPDLLKYVPTAFSLFRKSRTTCAIC